MIFPQAEVALGHVALGGGVVGQLGQRTGVLFDGAVPLVSPGVLVRPLHRSVKNCLVTRHSSVLLLNFVFSNHKDAKVTKILIVFHRRDAEVAEFLCDIGLCNSAIRHSEIRNRIKAALGDRGMPRLWGEYITKKWAKTKIWDKGTGGLGRKYCAVNYEFSILNFELGERPHNSKFKIENS